MEKSFSSKKYITAGWNIFRSEWRTFYKIGGILFIIILVTRILHNTLTDKILESAKENGSLNLLILSYILAIPSMIIGAILEIGWIKSIISIVRNHKTSIKLFKPNTRQVINFYATHLLYVIIVMIGFLLFIVPGIIWSIKYGFASYLVVDQNLRPIEALKRSAIMTRGMKWNLFIFQFAQFGVVLLGLLALGVGLFIAVPVATLAQIIIYDSLLHKKHTRSSKSK